MHDEALWIIKTIIQACRNAYGLSPTLLHLLLFHLHLLVVLHGGTRKCSFWSSIGKEHKCWEAAKEIEHVNPSSDIRVFLRDVILPSRMLLGHRAAWAHALLSMHQAGKGRCQDAAKESNRLNFRGRFIRIHGSTPCFFFVFPIHQRCSPVTFDNAFTSVTKCVGNLWELSVRDYGCKHCCYCCC